MRRSTPRPRSRSRPGASRCEGTLERLGKRTTKACGYYDRAYALAPGDPYVVSKYVEAHNQFGDALLAEGKSEEARALSRRRSARR